MFSLLKVILFRSNSIADDARRGICSRTDRGDIANDSTAARRGGGGSRMENCSEGEGDRDGKDIVSWEGRRRTSSVTVAIRRR